jgi:hypothetical protein
MNVFWRRRVVVLDVLLQCASLIPKFAYLLEEDTNFAREGFTKVIQISVRWRGKGNQFS